MPKIPKSLEDGLRDGRVIPFVGAGVSMAAERVGGGRLFPSWRELLLRGAERAEAEGKSGAVVRGLVDDDEPDYLLAAEKLRKKLGSSWASFLSDQIDIPRNQVSDQSLALARAIWRLGSRLLLTTNYDRVLSWACPEELRDDLKIWDIENAALKAQYLRRGVPETATLWHLHGKIDNPTDLILTPDGYARLYPSAGETEHRHRAALQTLRSVIAMRSLLFIGFSLDDKHLGLELQGVLDDFEGQTGPHYALVRESDAEQLKLLEKPVQPVIFEDFGGPLLDLVETLAAIATPTEEKKTPKRAARVGSRLSPETILLYAHAKDKALAEGARCFLWKAGFRTEELENDPLQPVGIRREALDRARALVIFHGEVDGEWARSRLAEAVKIVTDEPRHFVFSVFLGAPAGKDLTDYSDFGFCNLHLLDNQDGFKAESFEPFLASLGRDKAAPLQLPDNPYVGLRPFRGDEAMLFFGREEQVQDLLEQLHRSRFLAIVGSSGSGKSSLVRAGLIPSLKAGWLVADRDRWLLTTMKPGSKPLEALVMALAQIEPATGRFENPAGLAAELLEAGAYPLLEALSSAFSGNDSNLLIVVDQFEETFRFGLRSESEARQRETRVFVELILELSRSRWPIYVVLTMRSDFLGDCDKIEGLPEVLNRGQYLVPRLPRTKRREAIEGPARLYGRSIDPRLVETLLDDAAKVEDQLPLMQHALMRMWVKSSDEQTLDIGLYKTVGGLDKALSDHADEVRADLTEEDRELAEWVFRALTEVDTEDRRIRRPRTLAELVTETGGEREAIVRIVEAFRLKEHSFLMPPPGQEAALDDETLIDISHESLIRQWTKLGTWVDREAASARIYKRLVERSESFAEDRRNPLVERELEEALEWREEAAPRAAWAQRYDGNFERVMDFLEESQLLAHEIADAKKRQREALEKAEQQRARQTRLWNRFLVGTVVVVLGLAGLASWLWIQARERADEAREKTFEANFNLAKVLDEKAVSALKAAENDGPREAAKKAWLYSLAALAQPIGERRLPTAMGRLSRPGLRAAAFQDAWRPPKTPKLCDSLAISGDGRWLAAGAADRLIWVWDLDTGANVARFRADSAFSRSSLSSLAFNTDGSLLAFPSGDSSITLWNRETEKRSVVLPGHPGAVTSLAFSPDGRNLASGSYDGIVKIWDLGREESIATLDGHEGKIQGLAFGPHGRRLVSGSRDETVHVWNLETGESKTLKGHQNWVESVAFNPNGRWVASGSQDRSVRVWDVETGKEVFSGMHSDAVFSVAFSPDGEELASGATDEKIKVWNLETQGETATLHGHSGTVRGVLYSPDDHRMLISCSDDQSVRLWDLENQTNVATLESDLPEVSKTPQAPNTRQPPSSEPAVQSWESELRGRLAMLNFPDSTTSNIVFSADGRELARAGYSRSIEVWDLESQKISHTLPGHSKTISSLAFAPEDKDKDKKLASGSGDRTIILWDLATRQPETTLEGHTSPVSSLAFSSDGQWLASASNHRDSAIRIWDLESETYRLLEGHLGPVTALAFNPEDGRLASGSADHTVRIWDTESGESLATLVGHSGEVWGVAWSPDGLRLASGSEDTTVRLWDAARGRALATLSRHSKAVWSIAFSPDGQLLASGSDDGTIQIWNTLGRNNIATLEKHSKRILSVAFNPRGGELASASWDQTIRFWDVSYPQSLISSKTREEALGKLYRASLHVLGYRQDGLELEPVLQPIHLAPLNGYEFPQPRAIPMIDQPDPLDDKDLLEWLLEVGESLPEEP